MARYYFNLVDDDSLSYDDEGLELSTRTEVQAEAAKAMADMTQNAVSSGHRKRFMGIDVRDEVGPVLQIQINFEVQQLRRSGTSLEAS